MLSRGEKLMISLGGLILLSGLSLLFFAFRTTQRDRTPTAVAIIPTNTIPPTITLTETATETIPPTYTPQPPIKATSNIATIFPTLENTKQSSFILPTRKATATALPPTPTLTPTPTSAPQIVATFAFTGLSPSLVNTPSTAVPTIVPTFEIPETTTNILLLGSDIPNEEGSIRTDTIIIVSIDSERKTAAMLSLPRDLFVHIPGWTMNRLNTAISFGEVAGHPDGGIGSIKETILYNFGIPIHYYARVDFNGFKDIIDAIGGIEMPISCAYTDWRLISPELDPEEEDNWEQFELTQGFHQMDGDLALWYARSRLGSSDFDRGRRQQQLLDGILNHAVDLNLIPQLPALWQAFNNTVETDIDIGKLFQLAALAPAVRENGIEHLYLVGNNTEQWTVPGTGAWVLLPKWEGEMEKTVQRLFLPPSLSRGARTPISVEIVDASGSPDLAQLTVENLRWYGFATHINETPLPTQSKTELFYYGTNFKGSYDWLLTWVMEKIKKDLTLVQDEPSEYKYKIILGSDYDPCRPQMYAPKIFLEQNE